MCQINYWVVIAEYHLSSHLPAVLLIWPLPAALASAYHQRLTTIPAALAPTYHQQRLIINVPATSAYHQHRLPIR